MIEPNKIKEYSKKYADSNINFRSFLKFKADSDELDQQFLDLHNEIFIKDGYDCCKCANCCKVYDILIESKDIPAISQYLGQTENDFIRMYLKRDKEEADAFIVRVKPCSFLEPDGKCRIYDVRPSVCRDFPHTDKPKRVFSLLGVISFAEDCPVVFEIVRRLKRMYNFR